MNLLYLLFGQVSSEMKNLNNCIDRLISGAKSGANFSLKNLLSSLQVLACNPATPTFFSLYFMYFCFMCELDRFIISGSMHG